MVRDIPAEIIDESIKRRVNQVMDEATIEIPPDCPARRSISLEQLKRLAATGVVMVRILRSSYWN